MEKKFLAEYSSQEDANMRKYLNKLIKKNVVQYPSADRFGGLKEPVIHSDPHLYVYDEQPIWSQIPLSGTLIISLMNVSKEKCLTNNGFHPDEIPNLIEIAKSTGKIRFGLGTEPLDFEGLDYLDPIFEEFKPPLLRPIEISNLEKEGLVDKWEEEFRAISEIRFAGSFKNHLLAEGESELLWNNLMTGRMATYLHLKFLKMDYAVEQLENLMVDDPPAANSLFEHYMLMINAFFDPLTPNYNISLSKLQQHKLGFMTKTSNIKLPEMGKQIMKKLIPNANTFEGCQNLIQIYADNDLYKVMESFEKSIFTQQEYGFIKNEKELRLILDNVWKETGRMSNQAKGIELGIEATIGIVGTLVTLPLGAFGGLLAGLGYKIAEKYSGGSFSENIMKRLRPNSLVNIYDFKKKYKLGD